MYLSCFTVDAIPAGQASFAIELVWINPLETVQVAGIAYVELGQISLMIWVCKATVMVPMVQDASVQTLQQEECVSRAFTAQMALMNLYHVQEVRSTCCHRNLSK